MPVLSSYFSAIAAIFPPPPVSPSVGLFVRVGLSSTLHYHDIAADRRSRFILSFDKARTDKGIHRHNSVIAIVVLSVADDQLPWVTHDLSHSIMPAMTRRASMN
jgi:hypothetical protein